MNEIGSPAGIITHVSVGAASEFRERLVNIKKKLAGHRKNKAKMNMILAKSDKFGKGKKMPGELLHKLETLRKNRLKIVVEENRIVKERDALSIKLSTTDGELLTVKVKGIVYAGTTVFVSGYVFKVKDDIKGKVTFIFDKEELAVKMIK
jgi:hypothetical protein